MRSVLAPAALLLAGLPAAAQSGSVRLLHFSDYHSHAVPFRSEGQPGQGGIARALAFLLEAKKDGRTVVLSGGDMLNEGVPAWSDEYGCVEWPWLDRVLDAMALGNHDLDYGAAAFEQCRGQVRFPVLSANLRTQAGAPYLHAGGQPYLVKEVAGRRLGFFAVAGPDVQKLIRPGNLPRGTSWADATETARAVVAALRERERVDAVVLFGHQRREDDEALARAVPGIDLVLGSHSHHKGELATIAGTSTRYLAPYQYLAYVSEARLRFDGARLTGVEGGLVRMDAGRPEEPTYAARVAQLDRELRQRRPERFEVIGQAFVELGEAGTDEGESPVANWATETLRAAAAAQVFFTTASSVRGGLPAGPITREDFLGAFPYTNKLAVARFPGRLLLEWLALSVSRRGSDGFSAQSGLRYVVREGRPADVQVRRDPADASKGYAPLDPEGSYVVATTDYQAFFVDGYKELFQRAAEGRKTDLDAHATLLAALKAGPIEATLDGRAGR